MILKVVYNLNDSMILTACSHFNNGKLKIDYRMYYWCLKDTLLLIKGSTETENVTDTFL